MTFDFVEGQTEKFTPLAQLVPDFDKNELRDGWGFGLLRLVATRRLWFRLTGSGFKLGLGLVFGVSADGFGQQFCRLGNARRLERGCGFHLVGGREFRDRRSPISLSADQVVGVQPQEIGVRT